MGRSWPPDEGEELAPPAPSAPPPHFMGRSQPRHESEGVSPSGAFGATSPFHGEEFLTQLKRNEAAPAADTASTGKPPGDTLLVSAPLYGRCLLVEANLCADCRWTRTENELPPQCNDPMPMSRPLALFASTTFEVANRER